MDMCIVRTKIPDKGNSLDKDFSEVLRRTTGLKRKEDTMLLSYELKVHLESEWNLNWNASLLNS